MMLNCTLQICHSSLTLADGAARMKKIWPGHKDNADGGGNRNDVKELFLQVPFDVLSFLPYSLFSRCCVLPPLLLQSRL